MSFNGSEQNYPSAFDQYNASQNPQYYQQNNGNFYPAQSSAGRGLGIASLILGIFALLTGWLVVGGFLGLIGLILGIIAVSKARKAGGSKGLAITGIVLSVIGLITAIFMGIAIVALWPEISGAIQHCGSYIESGDSDGYQQCVYNYLGAEQPSSVSATNA